MDYIFCFSFFYIFYIQNELTAGLVSGSVGILFGLIIGAIITSLYFVYKNKQNKIINIETIPMTKNKEKIVCDGDTGQISYGEIYQKEEIESDNDIDIHV